MNSSVRDYLVFIGDCKTIVVTAFDSFEALAEARRMGHYKATKALLIY